MKTTIQQRMAQHPLTHRLGRATACAAIGLAGLFAPSAPGQTNSNGCTAAPAGLVGWWRAEGDANDAIGSVHGSLSGGTAFAPGLAGQAFYFDGVNDSVINATPGLTNIQESFTMEFWAYPTAGRATTPETYSGIAGISNQRYAIYPLNGELGPVGAGVSVGTNGISVFEHGYVYLSSLLVYDAPILGWTHVAVVYENRQPKLYLNGTLVRTGLVSTRIPFPSTWLGEAGTNSLNYGFYAGLLDEVSIYDRPLTGPELQAIFTAGGAGKCIGGVTNSPPTVAGVPVITGFSPLAAPVGTPITITGTNFSPVWASNIVYFGATRAVVTATTPTGLVATLPVGATHAPISVTVNGQTALSPLSFLPTFAGTGTNITAASFAPGQNLTVADGPIKSVIADLDGDGKPDLVVANAYAHNVSLLRNVSAAGTLDGSSFAPRVDLPVIGGTDSPRCIAVADVDGDGKLDILIGDQTTSSVMVYRNSSTPGSLNAGSFAAPVSFPAAANSYPHGLRVADLNGDGLPEILVANQSGDSISILMNIGTAGSLTTNSFAPQYALVTGPNPTDVGIVDVNGDGRPDLVTTAFGGSQLSLFRNVAGPGAAVSNWFTFDAALPALAGSLEITVADLDSDAKPDLVVASVHGYAVSVYRNQATAGAFTTNSFAARIDYSTPGWVHSISVADFNGDTKPDLAAVGELNSYLAVFQNQSTPGSIALASRVDFATGWNAWGVAAGDLDGDNRADIVFANSYDDTLTFYRNIITTPAAVLVDGNTPAAYNDSLGTILDGTAPQFPIPFDQGGGDPTFFPSPEPDLAAAAGILGDWLAAPQNVTTNWRNVDFVPATWALNTETAIIYKLDGGPNGIADLRGDFDADNGIYVWVNGQFKFGARAPGLPSPAGLFEYTNVFLGNLPPGSNYIQILREDSGITAGSQIRLTGTALSTNRQPPVIVQSPTNQTVAAGSSASFTVGAEGTPELSYQWRFEGADLAGQTGNSLTLLNVQPTNAGGYSVLVSNAYGTVTSSIATLTVLTYPPAITGQPQDRTVYAGKPATFSVAATGTTPLRYYWSHNATNLLAATTATLTLPNVQSNNVGLYQVIVSNSYGQATSRLAQLTVVPPPPCTPAPEGVIAWWPGQSNLWDVVGGFDAMLNQLQPPPASLLYTTGKVDAALNFGLTSSYGIVPTGGKLNGNTNLGLTIEGWIRPTTFSIGPLVEWNDGRSPTGAGLLINGNGPGVIEATLTDTNAPTRIVTLRSMVYAVTNGLWQHVALTYDKASGFAAIYVNGNSVAQTNVGLMTPNTSGDVYLGYRRFGTYSGARFNGALDEITLYNRALLPEELQAIVASDVTGKCPPPPPPCVPPPADIAAWWRGESNTVDMVAGNDAVRIPTNYPVALAYQAGQLGAAFRFYAQSFLSVPRSEGLDVGSGSGLTVEGWIYPATLTSMPIVEWTDTNSYGANLWLSYYRGPTVLEANLIDTAGGYHLIRSPINTIRGYSWQHVAVTYDKTTGLAALYSDGNLVISTNLGLFTPRTDKSLLIGYHPRNTVSGPDGTPPTVDRWFNGAIDELALYRRALTAAEIRNVSRTRPGKCLELPPTISRHPQPQVALEGGVARFDVGVGGTAPFQYQWLLSGQPLPGATNAVLSLAGIEPADAGLYSVIVSNLLGGATSRAAALTVLPANQCLPPAYGLVAFWRGESNIMDELGRHPAAWGTNTIPAYTTAKDGGKVATAFRFSGANHLQIPSDADLNVGAGGGFTIEGWIKPDSLSGTQPIWDWNDNRQNIGVGLMLSRTGPGALEVTLTDTNLASTYERVVTLTTGNFAVGSQTNQNPAWTHVALIFDKALAKVSLFVNGKPVAERSVLVAYSGYPSRTPSRLFSPATTGNLYLGWRPSGSYGGSRFRGAMDEVSVYYRALTPLELQAIYVVGANGKCTPTPTCQSFNPSIVSWWRSESNVLDSVDGNHGLAASPAGGPGIAYTNGVVGTAFKTSSSRYVQVPASPSLNVGTGSGLTFETWFKLDSANSHFALASWNLGSTQGVYVGTSPTRGPAYLEANFVDTTGIPHVLSYGLVNYVLLPVGAVPPWQHLAVTYDKPSGQAILYLNGSPVVITNLGSFTPRTTGVLNLGFRPQTSVGGASLTGTLDETTLYNRALTSGEITANYRNASNRCMESPVIVSHTGNLRVNPGSNAVFTVAATGSPLLRYQWGLDRYPALPGQTNASLILTNVQVKDAGRYWIRVTNAFGLAAVSNLVLTVNSAPRANNQTVTTPEDTARSFSLSASDPNQDSLLYTVLTQPTNGTLSGTNANLIYTPKPNFFGTDNFTFRANDGLLNSATAIVSIVVTPVNDPPTASSQIATTDEDTPLPLTLGATDVEGDALTFQITPPAHGTLSGTAPNLIYTPHANYFGDDLFTFTVTDSSNAVSQLAAVSITVRPVNDAPEARIEIAPLDELPGVTNTIVIAPVCCPATLRLDASQSSDVENDPLTYAWVVGTNVISTEVIVTNRFEPGTHEITLIVSDGTEAVSKTITVEIITSSEAVDYLKLLVEAGVTEPRTRMPLLNWLRQAGDFFDRCHVEPGVHFLELFKQRVAERLGTSDPELAKSLINTAEAIIEAAPDCDPCHRLGRKNRKHDRDNDRKDRDDRDGRNDQDDRNRPGDRNSNDRETARNERDAKSAREASPARSGQVEMRPLPIETGAERSQPKSRQ